MEKPIEDVILDAAQGAHRTSQAILALMQETGEEDPIQAIFAMLATLTVQQKAMLQKLDVMERTLIALTRQRDASPG